MKRKKDIFARIDEGFRKEIKDIQFQRMLTIDKKYPRPIGTEKLVNGIIRCSEWKLIKNKLMKEPRKEDMIE